MHKAGFMDDNYHTEEVGYLLSSFISYPRDSVEKRQLVKLA